MQQNPFDVRLNLKKPITLKMGWTCVSYPVMLAACVRRFHRAAGNGTEERT